MVFKLPKPKRRVNEKMTLEALHKSAETYRELYDDIRKKNDILQKQLDIAVKGIKAVLDDEFFCETADGGLIMYLYTALERIEEINK